MIVSWLKSNPKSTDFHSKNENENFVREKILSKVDNKEIVARSYALRLLIHYVGDIHQPLHCSSRYD